MGVWARNMVGYANALEEGVQLLILTSPVCLHGKDFSIKHALYEVLKIMKTLKNLRFMTKQINPCKFAIIINETNIKIVLAN
jgi:hypothetical protein